MAAIGVVVFVVAVVLGVVGAMVHAQLVAYRNHCDEAWANVVTELQRRHDLIPGLLDTARTHADHERRLLSELAELDALASRLDEEAAPTAEHEAGEVELEVGIQRLLAWLERQPDLGADHHFLELQRQLVSTADRVQSVLRLYNGNVRAHNNTVQQFPSRLIATLANREPLAYFRIDGAGSAGSNRSGT